MSREGRWEAMSAEIPDDVLHLFTAAGRHDEIAAAIEARFGGLSDAVAETLPAGAEPSLPPDLIQDLKRIPARFVGFATQ